MKFLALLFFAIFGLLFFNHVHGLAVMSVDLGSEWMKIAIVSPGIPMEVILNADSQRKTPVAVAFRDGERFIGDSALNVGIRFPEKTFTHFIDLLGKASLKSVAVQKYLQRFPYHQLVETDQNSIAFVLKENNQKQDQLFTPEELLSMLLSKAKVYAETASLASSPNNQAQKITDCVLTVPPYFSQIERKALKHAAKLAGLKVLQLINTNAAFALNYGVFRRRDFNSSQPNNVLFYDMGAGSAVATIASYQMVKTKDRSYSETNPQLSIKGIGYDRYLGGFEIQLRLRDHLLKLFSEQSKKTIDEIKRNKRAMSKLSKEAGRLKKVLSANSEHKAQIENVMNDIDLKAMVTREQLENLASDLLDERITKPLDDVFKNSALTLDEIDSFIIIGGATRIPKIQQQLKSYWSRELSKNVNADEGAAMGAAYQAAHLSKGFKVKTFHLKDANLYPINVEFEKENNQDEQQDNKKKKMSRILFARGNTFPQKKVITFNKHREDFEFYVSYGDASIFPQDSEKKIFKINLKNVAALFSKHSNSSVEPKGIKVHFRIDESGILLHENSEAIFEIEYEETTTSGQDNYEQISNLVGDAISKFGSKLSSLFGNNENQTVQANDTEVPLSSGKINLSNNTDGIPLSNAKVENSVLLDNETLPSDTLLNSTDRTDSSNSTDQSKPIVKKERKKKLIKEEIDSVVEVLDLSKLPTESIEASFEKLKSLDQQEREKLKRDGLKNSLESFIHESRDKLEQDEYRKSATEDEKLSIEQELKAAAEWLEYESDGADASALEQRLTSLSKLTKELFDRVKEHRQRPEAITALNNMLNITEMFYSNAINVSAEDQIFSEIEVTNLRKLIDETQSWLADSVIEQNNIKSNVNPKLTVKLISEKIALLDREVKYLLNKARIIPPKKKSTNEESNNTEKAEEIKIDETVEKDAEPTTFETEDSKRTDENEKIQPDKVENSIDNSNDKTEL